MLKKIFSHCLMMLVIVGCKSKKETVSGKGDILFTNLGITVQSSSDFFDYANWGGIKKNPIPSDQSALGIGQLVNEENLKKLNNTKKEK